MNFSFSNLSVQILFLPDSISNQKTLTNKIPRLDGFIGEFYQASKEESISILLLLFPNSEKESSQTHSVRLLPQYPPTCLDSGTLTSPALWSCWAMHLSSSSLANGFSWSCTSYTNCCSDISWLGPFSFLQEGSVEMIFSHR